VKEERERERERMRETKREKGGKRESQFKIKRKWHKYLKR
jgi:hypothetical protein